MSFFSDLVGVAAPIIGGIFGGPVGAAAGGAISGLVGGGGLKGAAVGAGIGYLGASAFGGGAPSGGDSATSGFWNGVDFSGTAPVGEPAGSGFWNGSDFSGTIPTPGSAGGSTWNGVDFTGGGGGGGGAASPDASMSRLLSFGKGGLGLSTARTAAGLYSVMEANKIRRSMRPPNPNDVTGLPGYQAGLEAVMRSMSAQGYQGSGNMMAALSKYGGDAYNQEATRRLYEGQAQAGGLFGTLSGLGLLTAGLGGFGRGG